MCRRRTIEESLKSQKKAAEMRYSWPGTKILSMYFIGIPAPVLQLVCILSSLDKAEDPYLGDMLVNGD